MHDTLGVGRNQHVEKLVGRGQHVERRQPASRPLSPRLERLALEQLHHHEYRAVIEHVVVEHTDHAAMPDRVGRVAFPQESRANARVDREFGVQDLDRAARAIAMRGSVDRCHAPHSEQRVEMPLVSQNDAHASLCSGGDGILVRLHRGPQG